MLIISDDYVTWVPSGGIVPDGAIPVGGVHLIRIANGDGSIVRPTFCWTIEGYYINDDYLSYTIFNSWEYLVIESGTFSWYPHVPGDTIPPNAIVTGHSATGDPYFSALASIDGQNVPGMYDPNMNYALIPRGSNVQHKPIFSILLFHKGK